MSGTRAVPIGGADKHMLIESLQEIALCTNSYSSNNCGKPLPALIQQCLEWESCMARDPSVVGRAKVGAEMLAEVINSFVEPISWKTLVSVNSLHCEVGVN